MTIRSRLFPSAALAVALLGLLVMATPASAAPFFAYNGTMARGRMTIGGLAFVTPAVAACPGSTTLVGNAEANDPAPVGVDNMDGTLTIRTASFVFPGMMANHALSATGTTGMGANRGDYDFVTDTFAGLTFGLTFDIRAINVTTCALGAVVCSGTATLTLAGTVAGGLPMPPGGPAIVTSTAGSIATTVACGFPWNLVFAPGAAWSLTANPAFPADPGAIFI